MRVMTVQLTESTAGALDQMAATQGASVTALIEALGECLAEHVPEDPSEPVEGTIDVAGVIVTARQITHARRKR